MMNVLFVHLFASFGAAATILLVKHTGEDDYLRWYEKLFFFLMSPLLLPFLFFVGFATWLFGHGLDSDEF